MPAYFDKGLMVGQSAWHGLGKVIAADDDRRFDMEACIELADMDDEITRAACWYCVDGDNIGEVPNHYVTVRKYRDGTIVPLGTVGARFRELQPRQAFQWFQPWLETKEVAIETAGTLMEGKVDWVMARILRDNMTVGDDEIAKYLLLSTKHDGTGSTSVGFTPQRVVCSNTLAMAHSNSASKLLRVRHTSGQHEALATIRETIDLIDQEFNTTAAQYQRLVECKVSISDLRAYCKMVNDIDPETLDSDLKGKLKKRVNKMVELALSGKGQSIGNLTAWSCFNGVTEFTSHIYGKDRDSRVQSLMFGTAKQLNDRAFELALQLAS